MALNDPLRSEADLSEPEFSLFEPEPMWAKGLNKRDREKFCSLVSQPREIASKVSFGQQPLQHHAVAIVLDGWIGRHVLTAEGRRQMISIALSGDLLGLNCFYSGRAQYAYTALTDCRIVEIDDASLRDLIRDRHQVGLAMGLATSLENARLGEDAVRLGRRTARERIAHFFCEIVTRLAKISSPTWRGYYFPLTQEHLASLLGLSLVHVNRTLQSLRTDGLVDLRAQRIKIPDWNALIRVAKFDRRYLDLEPRAPESSPTGRGKRLQPRTTVLVR